MTRSSPCKCYKDITLITPPPRRRRRQNLNSNFQKPHRRRSEAMRLPGYFFFNFSFLFLFFGAVAFHCQCLKDFSLCVKKNTKKTNLNTQIHPRVTPPKTLHGLWVHSSKKTKSVVQSFTDLNRPDKTPSTPCNTP